MGSIRPVSSQRSWLIALLTQPASLLVLGFAVLIVFGTVALTITESTENHPIGWLDALFHATSAVCVTGLSTFPGGAAEFSRPGQVILLILIQVGGLGVMTVTALAVYVAGRGLSFSSHAALQDTFFESSSVQRLPQAIAQITLLVFILEGLGAVALFLGVDRHTPEAGFTAVFHSISAFCNAGFSVKPNSLASYAGNMIVMPVISLLIIAGGLGYSVLFELFERMMLWLRRKPQRRVNMTLHSRVVLWSSAFLTLSGFVFLLITDLLQHENKGGYGYDVWTASGHALFQSITARTAGFSTLDIGTLTVPAILILTPLMFIGGSPGSCAGGVKTTSFMVWMTRIRARLHGEEAVNLFGRELPRDIVRRAALLIVVAALWNGTGILLMCVVEPVGQTMRFEHVMFEQFSALGTVGLSAGITPMLTSVSKAWLIASMFVGRLGPLTMAFVVLTRSRANVSFPTERVMIG